ETGLLEKKSDGGAKAQELKQRIDELEEKVKRAESDIVYLQINQNPYNAILLKVTDTPAYQRLETNMGTILVANQDVTPYLDGYRVRIKVGNPQFITFDGFKINVEWGEPYKAEKKNFDWASKLQSKEFNFTRDLAPGAWTDVTLNLNPATAE